MLKRPCSFGKANRQSGVALTILFAVDGDAPTGLSDCAVQLPHHYRRVEAGVGHFLETPDEQLLVCVDSLDSTSEVTFPFPRIREGLKEAP
jgi:hypothetical protein